MRVMSGAAAKGGGSGGVPIVPKPPSGGGVTVIPLNPSLLQHMKGHSPAKASTGLAQDANFSSCNIDG